MEIVSSIEQTGTVVLEVAYYYALTLAERIALFHSAQDGFVPCLHDRLKMAMQRLERWRDQKSFKDSSIFAERLAMDGITEQELLTLLAMPIEQMQQLMMQFAPPTWINELTQALADCTLWEECALSEPKQKNAQLQTLLLDVFEPLVKSGETALTLAIQKCIVAQPVLPFDPVSILDLCLANLLPHLQLMAMKTLILEMHVARLEQRLSGETPEERFNNFIRQLCQREQLRAFLHEYPVLARATMTVIRHWTDFSLELLQRLCADWTEICALFARGTDPGKLIEIHGSAGDTHRNGRSVAILRFSSGLQIVYKPRSLAIDQHFQEVLVWVNAHGITLPLHPITILDKGSYGWAEFVMAHSCASEEEVAHFYERQGSYLALLYALDASDFHHENVLAAGEHPLLIDLEALFHPRIASYDVPEAGRAATKSIRSSVLRIGLLPQRGQRKEGEEGIDVSGLGGQEGQQTPHPVPVWKASGTDQMHIAHEYLEIPESKNRPKLRGKSVEALDYMPSLLRGFTEMYQMLVKHREEWVMQILPRFEYDEVRAIMRHTRTYAALLSESYHPERLRDALEQEKLFDHLWYEVAYLPQLRQIITAERQDLLQGDIPLFRTWPGSKDIVTSRNERIMSFFAEPSLKFAKRRVQQMDNDDLARQQWIIKASLGTTAMDGKQMRTLPLKMPQSVEVTAEELIQSACVIGDRLLDLALNSVYGVNWLGVVLVAEKGGKMVWNLEEINLKLYDGTSGIILFLSYLGALTGNIKYTALARQALLAIQTSLNTQGRSHEVPLIGAFTGLGSMIYLFSHLSVLWHDSSFICAAEALVDQLDQLIEHDVQFDMIAGSAGCIASLLSFYQIASSPKALAMAIRCGEHLLAHTQPMAEGVGWCIPDRAIPLPGFSHGGAGIALSLLNLAVVSKQGRFRQTAQAALAYERSLFIPERQNWMLPSLSGEKENPVSWCHGAPGIGLSRLAALKYMDDALIRQEIAVALETTIAEGFGRNQSLCHGELGNLETVLVATRVLAEPRYYEALKRLTALVFKNIQEYGWVTGVPLGVETPGLMTGLAGIGYELLRLAEPEQVPSVLLLAPPCIAKKR